MFGSRVNTLGKTERFDPYGVGGVRTPMVAAFDDEYYRSNGSQTTFSNLITHSRTSNATMVDSDGLIKWGPHNLAIYSNSWDQWSDINSSGATITDDAAVGPDGTLTAGEISSSSGQLFNISPNATLSLPAGITVTVACWVKSAGAGADTFRLLVDGGVFSSNLTATDEWVLYTADLVTDGSGAYGITRDSSNNACNIYVWGFHLYRSDLGGMVDNPDRGDSYVPTTSSAVYLPRRGHHKYNGDQWVNKGILVESEARTNLLSYSNDFTQWTVGRVTLGASTTSPDGTSNASKVIIDSGTTGQTKYISLTATVAAGIATYTFYLKYANWRYVQLVTAAGISTDFANFDLQEAVVTGGTYQSVAIENAGNDWYRYSVSIATSSDTNSVFLWPISSPTASRGASSDAGNDSDGFYIYGAQFEQASTPSSYIPTNGSTVTRAAETVTVPYANLPYSSIAMSIAMMGEMNYADDNSAISSTPTTGTINFYSWALDSSNYIATILDTELANEGRVAFTQEYLTTYDTVSSEIYSPDLNVPFNIASRHGSTFINGAIDGVALTANTTPTALPDLSTTNLSLAYDFMGTISTFRMWDRDLGDTGIAEATS